MNMSDPQVDLASLVSRIELLEERQNLLAKYTVEVKRHLERSIERFNTRPELPMLENLQGAIAQLCEKLALWHEQQNPAWHQPENPFVTWNETFDTDESFNETEAFEMPIQEQKSPSQWGKLEEANSDAQEKTDNWPEVSHDDTTAFPFEVTTLHGTPQQAIATAEFLRQYNEQKRNFIGANLSGVNLTRKFLSYDLNFSQANLSQANLTQANLSGVNLSRANLKNAQLNQASLWQTNLEEATLEQANLTNAMLKEITLEKANLSKANLKGANLSQQVNLNEANLYQANLSQANLRRATLIQANLSQANLSQANLLDTNLEGANLQGAILAGASLYKTNLQGANLQGAILEWSNDSPR